jgi:hypothetical protein
VNRIKNRKSYHACSIIYKKQEWNVSKFILDMCYIYIYIYIYDEISIPIVIINKYVKGNNNA